ncbi:S1/P1 nuclease [Cercophora newfieldiana]|uniref:S1/P1 nuclease n=1 Tax=Cercophora newfieldiana TaxID=92897 RepID=A0AA39XW56_9PEZI|nr:S1/P1 nuclease [Cercophora newfieldiana]
MLKSLPLALLAATPALSWDGFGHQTVGYIAQKYFTSETNATLGAIIGLNPEFDIGDAAAWADTVRDGANLPWSKNWHFINPKGDDPNNHICTMNYTLDCPGSNCIVAAIMNQTSILLDTARDSIARRNATMWLLHFFGDLHQPMHTSGYKLGGNAVRPVCWDQAAPCPGGTRNLHAIWDSAIPRKLRGMPEETTDAEEKIAAIQWAGDIFAKQQAESLDIATGVCSDLHGPGCVLAYAAESNRLVCSNALKDGEAWVLSHDLSKGYYEENAMVVEDRVGKAGVRLAAWMNAVVRVLAAKEREEDL